jgi:zinc/manganese transport system substrate-binding protein
MICISNYFALSLPPPMIRFAWILLPLLLCAAPSRAALKVAALHPILEDLARQVGGDQVEVVEVLKPGNDIHHFEPSPQNLAAMRGAALVLASGKGLESYLPKLQDSLAGTARLIEVGEKIPSLPAMEHEEEGEDAEKEDHHDHQGNLDPHWWHSADNMMRAARILADVFAEADPAHAAEYQTRAKIAANHFHELKVWAQKEISQIPRAQRKLVTAHAAFNYFCKEYGFQPITVLGLARTDDASLKHIAKTIEAIRQAQVRAVFAEDQANPKVMAEIVRSTGVKLGEPLVADGTAVNAHTFETVLRHNVTTIVNALKP